MQMLIGINVVILFIIIIEMDKSEIRKMYNFNFIRGEKIEYSSNYEVCFGCSEILAHSKCMEM